VVKVNDIVVEVETAKSLVELPIPWAGTVAALLAPEGATVEVGSAIIAIDDPLYAGPPPSASGPAAASSSLTAMAGNLVGGADSSTPSTSLGARGAKLDGGGAGAGPATGGTSGGTTGGIPQAPTRPSPRGSSWHHVNRPHGGARRLRHHE
jgi:pyruvate dehydrogenase E2 component (dihydrolipoamide acetyltransferase)